jgi:hypothetical protein
MNRISQCYSSLAAQAPNIGGEANMFTEWLTYGVYYLAVYQILKEEGLLVEEVGEIIFDTYKTMADYPKWILQLVSRLKYGGSYVKKLKAAVNKTQERQFPGDWVASFIEGDGEDFDYGLDIVECGICKFYQSQGADELTPYLCLSDYVVSDAMGRGLVRYQTLAEGGKVCDFRFRRGRPTYVHPLRDGWPPKFHNSSG